MSDDRELFERLIQAVTRLESITDRVTKVEALEPRVGALERFRWTIAGFVGLGMFLSPVLWMSIQNMMGR